MSRFKVGQRVRVTCHSTNPRTTVRKEFQRGAYELGKIHVVDRIAKNSYGYYILSSIASGGIYEDNLMPATPDDPYAETDY